MKRRDSVPARWAAAILVCGKCSKKVGGGFGAKGRTSLARALVRQAGGRGRKAAYGVVETKCLKLCPKGAVTVIDGRQPGEWLLVRPGAAIEEIAARLALPVEERD